MNKLYYVDGSDDGHVGAVELQPHLLNSSPELCTSLWTLAVHLHDVQAGWEHLGLTLRRRNTNLSMKILLTRTDRNSWEPNGTEVRMRPRQLLSISSFSTAMQSSVRKSRLRLLTGGLCMFITATPVDTETQTTSHWPDTRTGVCRRTKTDIKVINLTCGLVKIHFDFRCSGIGPLLRHTHSDMTAAGGQLTQQTCVNRDDVTVSCSWHTHTHTQKDVRWPVNSLWMWICVGLVNVQGVTLPWPRPHLCSRNDMDEWFEWLNGCFYYTMTVF